MHPAAGSSSPTRIKVIGRRSDLVAPALWPGWDVLNVPDAQWSEALNIRWIQEGIAARQHFRVISPPRPENLWRRTRRAWKKTVFAWELELLEAAGYVQVGNCWVPR